MDSNSGRSTDYRLVMMMAKMMAKMKDQRSRKENRWAHCLGRNYQMEIRLVILTVQQKAKNSVNYSGRHLVSSKVMTKGKCLVRLRETTMAN